MSQRAEREASAAELAALLDAMARRCAGGESLASALADEIDGAASPALRRSLGPTVAAWHHGASLPAALARAGQGAQRDRSVS
ncbi:MAG TPA: hypothetical protein PLV68_07065, partial [Ilumatobacteraceae bacterium]|nr:hypothetical protein [Ilumatobacteraceae bacterium]